MAWLYRPRTSGLLRSLFLKNDFSHEHVASSIRRLSGNATTSTQVRPRFGIPREWNSPMRTSSMPEAGRWMSSVHSSGQEGSEGNKRTADGKKLTLYRAKWIRPIRLLVRLKLLQFGGVMALTIPLAEYSQQGTLSAGTSLAVVAIVGGAGAASTTLWYYSRRLIGEMALLLPDLRIVQISVLDFWGNREDLHYNVRDILPPLKGMTMEELEKAAQQIVIPLDVVGDRQFFLSLRHGYLIHKDILFSILNGSADTDSKNTESGI